MAQIRTKELTGDEAITDANQIIHDLGIITGLENEIMYSSKEGLLEPYGEALSKKQVEDIRREDLTTTYLNLVLMHERNKTLRSIKEFTAPENLIACDNGIVDIFTGELQKYERGLIEKGIVFTSKFAFEYDPKAKCPKILVELKAAQPDPLVRYQILRSWAICFDRKPMKRQAELWIGENDTRKSTLLNVLKTFLGKDNVSTQSLEMLTSSETESQRARAQLFGKAANIFSDMQFIELKELGLFKLLLGGDTVPARFMYQSPIEIAPYCKFFFSCNVPPYIKDEMIQSDTAFFERFKLRFFEQKIEPRDIKPDYLEELTTKEELSGLFNILAGILRGVWWFRDYGYSFNAKEAKDLWNLSLRRSDKINKIISEKCVLTPEDRSKFIPVIEVAEAVKSVFRSDGYEVPSNSDINERLTKICGKQSNDGKVRIWKGIKWRDESQSTFDNGFNGFSSYKSLYSIVNRERVHQKSVKSVKEGILKAWFSNPLRLVYPQCKQHDKTFKTQAELEAHIKIAGHGEG